MAVEEHHSPTPAGNGAAVAPEKADGSSLDLERFLDTAVVDMAEEAPALDGSQEERRSEAAYEPRLLVAEERTPLPEVDRAMPFLSLFPAIASGRHGRYKLALLKTLQMDGSGRWRIRQLQEAVAWLDPAAVALLARELRDDRILALMLVAPSTG